MINIFFSNEQIRDGLLSLLSSYNALENKLERHEQREKALGEVIKRGLQQLQKGQRIFEPMRSLFSRLDERLSQLETMLLAQESSQKDQKDKLNETLAKMLKWMSDHDSKDATRAADLASLLLASKNAKDTENEDDDLGKKIEDLSDSVKRMRQEIAEVAADRATADLSTKGLVAQAERLVNSKLASADEIVSKLEEKLTSFYITSAVTTVPPPPLHNIDWENSVQKSLSSIEGSLQGLSAAAKNSTENTGIAFDKDFFLTMTNETLEAIEDMRIEVLAASDKSTTKTSIRIKEATTTLDSSISEIARGLSESVPTVEALYDRVGKSYADLQNEVAALSRLETILLTNSESIMEIKRGLEYNKHTIKEEIGELVRLKVDAIDQTLNKQFNMMNETINSNHYGALTNLTKKIEEEVSMVWRQIGIMSNEVQMSKSSLMKLNEQTESYVNGTFATMDGMGGKVYFVFFFCIHSNQLFN